MKKVYVIKLSTGKLLGAFTVKETATRVLNILRAVPQKAEDAYEAFEAKNMMPSWETPKECHDTWDMLASKAIMAALSKEEKECCQRYFKGYTPTQWMQFQYRKTIVLSEVTLETEKKTAKGSKKSS